ncbi:predicted protein [Nematostella vectensis]|uniref:Major facilitator superfamily (MFS) profile domain-containing protein n=2 Tax=Nematostella vectensis TaxID=45351 RepID=A7SHR0_NEMVE|nr:predicted protein [Nematostella vectensis]|eukprot:XP_001628842.1 predicted protein [Nematostella vectensis]
MDSPEDPYIAPLASGELEINRVDLGKVGLKMEEMVPLDLSDEPRKPSRLRLFKCPVIGLKMLLLAEMSVVLFFNFASFSILATFFPNVALDRGADRTQIGLIFGAYPAIAFPASLVYGALIPLIGTEKLLLAGIFTNGITVVLFG